MHQVQHIFLLFVSMERMEGVRLTKRADGLRVEGKMRRGTPRLRREECVKRFGRSGECG